MPLAGEILGSTTLHLGISLRNEQELDIDAVIDYLIRWGDVDAAIQCLHQCGDMLYACDVAIAEVSSGLRPTTEKRRSPSYPPAIPFLFESVR
jgi:hypothetical protein